jgi:hypothetical protein
MAIDEKIVKDFDTHTSDVDRLHNWLNQLYYDPEFSTLFNRPILSMLMTGCDYLSENLKLLRNKYITLKSTS